MNISEQKELINEYHKWICHKAEKYGKMSNNYLDFDDLYSIGSMAIFQAIESYDPTKGTTVRSHIMNYIGWSMQRAIRDCGEATPSQTTHIMTVRKYAKLTGKENPTPEEVFDQILAAGLKDRWTIKRVRDTMEIDNITIISRDFWATSESEKASMMRNKMEPIDDFDMEETTIEEEQKHLLYKAISELKEQYQRVMIGRICDEKTIEELGNEMCLTRERIRQIVVVATKQIQQKIANYMSHIRYIPKKSKYGPKSNKQSIYEPPVKKIVHTFYKEHGDMIFAEEYKLSPMCFKILQFLKSGEDNTNKSALARGVDCSIKSMLDNLKVLQSLNFIDEDNNVLPRDSWKIATAQKKETPKLELKAPFKKEAESSGQPPIIQYPDLKPVFKAPEPPKIGKQLESLCGKFYTITEDLGGRYEVFDPSVGKYTIIKENEVKRIF